MVFFFLLWTVALPKHRCPSGDTLEDVAWEVIQPAYLVVFCHPHLGLFIWFFPLWYCLRVDRRYLGNCKASMNSNTKEHKTTAVTFIRRWKNSYHTFSRHAAFWGRDMPQDSCSCITNSRAMRQFFSSPAARCLPLLHYVLLYIHKMPTLLQQNSMQWLLHADFKDVLN